MKRVFLIVLDSFGIGAAPDAADFGDEGVNTLGSIAATGTLKIPNLTALGFGNIDGVGAVDGVENPLASVARLRELSRGKDTTTGHWEIAGKVSEKAMPTYPDGFPDEVISAFEAAVGRKVICNLPYSGTDVIRDFGEQHVKTGDLIVYTSADSVFQIAAHEQVVPIEELYMICETARGILQGKHGVGRVIARPFEGTAPDFKRTGNRRDFSLKPPYGTMNDRLKEAGLDVIGVGKIGDIFAMAGITETHPTHCNKEGMEETSELANKDFHGLCFINLVDFDMLYGHRQDAVGYANAINEFDKWLGDFLPLMRDEDILMITADHGCDPSDNSTDHTREYVPLIKYSKNSEPKNYGTVDGFGFIADTVLEYLLEEK
ncbi:MAG: phosphopentomutase [Ruminococcaceae bacterium]|nr:phosphopentomutase [Oscillospiraceae bacterium]